MSTFMYTANGSAISNKQRVIEGMADSAPPKPPSDFFNLAGNLKLSGSMRATNFYKEDGTEIQSVVKMGLPENVYYVDKRLGINQDRPMADFDVKGKARIVGELGVDGSMGVSGNFVNKGTGSFSGRLTAEDDLMVSKHAGIGGNLGVTGNFNTQGTSTFKGLVTAEDAFIANKNADVRGNLGVVGMLNTQGASNFRGLVTAEDAFIVGKNADVRGNLGVVGMFNTQGASKFKGLVTTEDAVIVGKNADVRGNLGVVGMFNTQGASTFKGLVTAEDELVVGKNAGIRGNLGVTGNFNTQGASTFRGPVVASEDITATRHLIANGNANIAGAVMLGQGVPHPDVGDGAFYRADGQVQIATDDLIRLRHVGSKATGIQFDVREGAGDVNNPNGQMKITRQGIMFGGPNAGRETNSGQISAGLHIPNSLNIVGMSADTGATSRRVDMWAEGGLNVYGPTNVNGSTNIVGGVRANIENPNGQTRITNQGIIFGGPNAAGRETNSGQISAGLHQADSLNIVGMSRQDRTNRRVDMWAEGGFNVNGPTNVNGSTNVNGPTNILGGARANIENPNGQTRITNQGIMFGGPNAAGREINSGQISAGLHRADSLNIVGMSRPDRTNRRVDMWAEGGFSVYGPIITNQKICIRGPNNVPLCLDAARLQNLGAVPDTTAGL